MMFFRRYCSSVVFITFLVLHIITNNKLFSSHSNPHLQHLLLVNGNSITDERSPYYQYLPDCVHEKYAVINKHTSIKGIVCPLIKNEIGFLSEWTAYYEMQGFNHIVFYDNNSTTSLTELDPWIKTGFVTIVKDWWVHDKKIFTIKKYKYFDMMKIKMMAEVDCKHRAVKMGYEIFVSLDLDEYLVPGSNSKTVMDELVEWFAATTRGVVALSKHQFSPVPHILGDDDDGEESIGC